MTTMYYDEMDAPAAEENINPECPGHEYAEGENSRVEWCDFSEECPEAPASPDESDEYRGPGCSPSCGC